MGTTCNGSATASYDNGDVCGAGAKQEVSGFLNLDVGHENHDDTRDDGDRDSRYTIPNGSWYCGLTPCAAETEVQTTMSAAQLVARLVDDGFLLNRTTPPKCGLGAELVLLVPILFAARRRFRRV
ncbi:MAG: hypothetical protein GY937_13215 [bacterium]|nr:hypothetical protein [bacterium]